jgi:hypothetical protein
MASIAQPYTITVQAVDDDGARSTHSINVPANTDPVAVTNYAEEYVALVAAVTDGGILSYTVSQTFYDNTYPAGAAGSDVENKGVLIVQTADNAKSVLALPSIKEAVLVASGVLTGIAIDTSLGPVAALIEALLSGIEVLNSASEPVTVQPTDRRGFDFVALRDAYKQNRRSQKRQRRRG